MTNKEKYPNAEIKGPSTWGYYIVLNGDDPYNATYLVKNAPSINNCANGWHPTREQAETALNNFMNETHKTPEITLKEIKRQLEEAKKLVGQKIKNLYSGGIETCQKVFIAVDVNPDTSSLMDKEINKMGYCIGIKTDNRNTLPLSMCEKIKTVSVAAHNGQTYNAESDGDCWKFGCARISKTLIKQSLNLMNDKNFGGNRQIEKITIGKCDFTRETLKALVELGE